jgi:lipopolysaccharide transport system ATP-binding protein
VKFRALQLETADGIDPAFVESFQDLTVELTVEALGERPFHVGLALVRNDRDNVFGTSTHFRDPPAPLSGRGEHRLRLRFPHLPLLSGEYLWSVYVLDDTGLQVLDMAECIRPFRILNRGSREVGLVHLPHEWELVA